ncbi:MAG: metal ABC transporter ATP-binding protein [Thermoprotei archaeon]|nr:MAG: metal ABC transporter ATP-binding protein [Thermoprotei archaeon]
MGIVVVKDLTVEYEGVIALEDVSLEVSEPSFTVVLGPNGAGKSTLLKTLIGFIRPVRGIVRVLGIDPTKEPYRVRKLVGYLPQREFIERDIPIKVRDVILFGLLARRPPPRVATVRDLEKVREVLKIVGLEELADKRFDELSGGQQQRVLIARALVSDPKLLLLDEPLSATDVKTQVSILELLRELVDERNVSVIMVTHDVSVAVEYSDYVALLNRRLLAFGKPGDVLTPSNLVKAYGEGLRMFLTKEGRVMFIADQHICDFCEYCRSREWRRRRGAT